MSYLVCILNHKSRNIDSVSEKLSQSNIPFKVFTDDTDYKDNKNTRWLGLTLNYLSILKHETSADWKIIIHDDIEFDIDLFKSITHVLKYSPKTLISFYNPTNKAYGECFAKGNNVLKTYANWWSQCHAFPKELEQDYLIDCDKNPNYVSKYAEDGLLQRYLSKNKIPVYAIVPSLIQHTGYDKSTFGLPAKCGKNLRNSATFQKGFNVFNINWLNEFNNPYLNLTTKSYD
jgi:hypothetical protein